MKGLPLPRATKKFLGVTELLFKSNVPRLSSLKIINFPTLRYLCKICKKVSNNILQGTFPKFNTAQYEFLKNNGQNFKGLAEILPDLLVHWNLKICIRRSIPPRPMERPFTFLKKNNWINPDLSIFWGISLLYESADCFSKIRTVPPFTKWSIFKFV